MLAAHAAALVLVLISTTLEARMTSITVSAVEPFAAGASLGGAGAYERVRGTFKGELDPRDARNRVIANLDKAPRNSAGKVEYEADFFMAKIFSDSRL